MKIERRIITTVFVWSDYFRRRISSIYLFVELENASWIGLWGLMQIIYVALQTFRYEYRKMFAVTLHQLHHSNTHTRARAQAQAPIYLSYSFWTNRIHSLYLNKHTKRTRNKFQLLNDINTQSSDIREKYMRCKKIQNKLKQISALWLQQRKPFCFLPRLSLFLFLLFWYPYQILFLAYTKRAFIIVVHACLCVCVCVPLVLFLSNHRVWCSYLSIWSGPTHQYVYENSE